MMPPIKKIIVPFFLALLWVLPFNSFALEATITKIVDNNGFLNGVLLTTADFVVQVSVYGIIEKVTPNDPKTAKLNELRQVLGKPLQPYPTPVTLTYYAVSPMDGNGGKISGINGVTVTYYPCNAANQTLNSVQYYGQNISPSPNNNDASPLTVNPRYRNACPNSANGGKLQSIGDVYFSYYPDNNVPSNSGKLQRIGSTYITYYATNGFLGQDGRLQSFNSQ